MDPQIHEWISLTIRWIHIITGIAWIGASFYFNWLEHNLERDAPPRDELAGTLWAIHGGGFYFLEKYRVAPRVIPSPLHWFKWEAYMTWVSGFALMCIVYYFRADAMMIDGQNATLTSSQAISLSLSLLLIAWLAYHALCKTKLVNHHLLFGSVIFLGFTAAAFFLTQLLSGRAAYIQIGAMVGTIMVANVFFVIIPSQKALVAAAEKGQSPDPRLGQAALKRSLHNNYFTLPVLFIMISNHYPNTFGHEYNWLVLAALAAVSIFVRHYFNVRKKQKWSVWILPSAVLAMVILVLATRPEPSSPESGQYVSFTQVSTIIGNRCLSCHSRNATDDVFTVAPNGVYYDTPQEIQVMADKILQRTVIQKTMPLANKTGMTEQERKTLEHWIRGGAKIN